MSGPSAAPTSPSIAAEPPEQLRILGVLLLAQILSGTGLAAGITVGALDQRIDHIFFRPGREDQHVIVEGVQLAGDAVDGVYPSDHRAVVADLRWRG